MNYQLLNTPVSTDYLTIDDLSNLVSKNQLTNYFPISGGTITGDTNIDKSTLSINFGNFIESDDPHTISYTKKNSFIQGETAPTEGMVDSYGPIYTGTKGYAILSIDTATNVVKLSGDISILASLEASNSSSNLQELYNNVSNTAIFPSGSKVLRIAYANNHNTSIKKLDQVRFTMALHTQGSPAQVKICSILDANNGLISVENIPGNVINKANTLTSIDQYKTEFEDDDNYFYAPGLPEIGNLTLEKLNGQHAEGGSTKVTGKFAHGEGRDTLADVRFSHAEGTCNYAGGIASHAEGRYCSAKGEYSHAAGIYASSNEDKAWTWNGNAGNANTPQPTKLYSSHGNGTFNINPEPQNGSDDPATGFFIGNQSLADMLDGSRSAIATVLSSLSPNDVVPRDGGGYTIDNVAEKLNKITNILIALKDALQ